MQLTNEIVLKKHINAIHCSNNLTLVQRKIFNALIFNAYSDLSTKDIFSIDLKQLCTLIGYDSRDFRKLKTSLNGLLTTVLQWNVIESKKAGPWKACTLLAAVGIERGVCTYEISRTLKNFFYKPHYYGEIDLKVATRFRSSYALALYENCIRYIRIPQTSWISLTTFRTLMGISGTKYKNFKDLKKRVIDIALKEINANAPINVEVEYEMSYRNVVALRFKIQRKKLEISAPQTDSDLYYKLVSEFYIPEKKAHEILEQFDASYIISKMEYVQNKVALKPAKISNISGYLISALNKNYIERAKKVCSENTFHSLLNLNSMTATDEISSSLVERQSQDQEIAKRNIEFDGEIKRMKLYLKNLQQNEYNNIMNDFENYLLDVKDFHTLGLFKKNGFANKNSEFSDSKVVFALFKRFLQANELFEI